MIRETKIGFVAHHVIDDDFSIRDDKDHLQTPSGIFVHGDRRAGVWMNYAGVDHAAGSSFSLPTSPEYLREVAQAILAIADRIQNQS